MVHVNYYQYILQRVRLDSTDLQIIKLLAEHCRTSYSNIASAIGITPSAAKERINKMVSSGVIESFNPVIFGYEKFCILILRNIDKMIKEQDIFKKVLPPVHITNDSPVFNTLPILIPLSGPPEKYKLNL